jgi:hypothetical protein
MASKRHQRPWQRRSSDIAAVAKELARRRLATLEDCRTAWELGRDPLALAVALTKSDLPQWLTDALLLALYAPALLDQLWDAKHRDTEDSARAWEVVRALPGETWERAYEIAATTVAENYDGATPATGHAAHRSYTMVARRLKANPGRYYWDDKAHSERIREAAGRLSIQHVSAELAALAKSEGRPRRKRK